MTVQLMNQIAAGFAVHVILGVLTESLAGSFYTNPMMSFVMKGMGVYKAGFIVNPVWVTRRCSALGRLFSRICCHWLSHGIRKISAYLLVTE